MVSGIRSAGRALLLVSVVATALVVGSATAAAVTLWPTYHLDQNRGANDASDAILGSGVGQSPSWNTPLDGAVYAEPLVSGTQVLVATENDTVYSLDSITGGVSWSKHLGTPVPRSALPCGNIDPSGITGTPVLDTTTNTLYVVTESWTGTNGSIAHKLYGLDIANNGNILVNGVAADPVDAAFTVRYQQQRAALALTNGRVIIPYGGRSGDCNPGAGNFYHGWVISILENGTGMLSKNVTATGRQGGIWGTSGPSTDANGDIYVTTGNGITGTTNDNSDSVVKLSKSDLSILDKFTPTNWSNENASDADLGSSGPMQLTGGLIYQVGKQGKGFLLDATNLSRDTSGGGDGGLFSPNLCSGFGGSAYDAVADIVYSTCTDGVRALQIQRSGCANGAAACYSVLWHGPGDASGPPILAGGRVWVRNRTFDFGSNRPALYALNASDGSVAQTLTNGITTSVHFGTPTAAGGQIFIAGDSTVMAFSSSCSTAGGPISGGYQLDGWGGVHNYCGAPAVTFQQAYWPGWDIARGIAQRNDHRSGYVLDGYGGVHEFAAGVAAPTHWGDGTHAYWSGWDIARGIVLDPCDATGQSGYVVDGWGGIHEFGSYGASLPPHFADSSHAYWPGWDIARGIVMNPCGGGAGSEGGYVLDGYGGVHKFGTATPISDGSHAYWPGWDIAKAIVSSGAGGGYTLDGYGGVHNFGTEPNAVSDGSHAYWPGWDIARSIAVSNGGGYTLDGWGGIHQFGSASPPAAGGYWPGWDIARGISR